MAVDSKKEKERDEVHRAIWAIADELRGSEIMKKPNAEIKEIVAREQVLRDEIDKIIAEIEGGV